MKLSDNLLQSLRAIEGVGSAEPFAEGEAIMANREKSELVVVKGISETAHNRLMRQTHTPRPFFTPETIAVGELHGSPLKGQKLDRAVDGDKEIAGQFLEAVQNAHDHQQGADSKHNSCHADC